MNRIEAHHVTNPFAAGAAAAMQRQATGLLGHEPVQLVPSALSVLENAREEVSIGVATLGGTRSFKDLQVGAGRGVRRMTLEQIQAYLDNTRAHPDPSELAELIKRMQTSRQPRETAQRQTRAPAHQYALLQLALDDAQKRGLPADALQRLEDAIESLDFERGREVQAGLNTSQVAADFAPDAAGFENFQQAYTDIVLGENTFAQTLQVVLKRVAGARGQDFHRGLQALLHALGAELSAAHTSTDPRRLQALVQDVYQLEVAGTVLANCNKLSGDIERQYGITSVDPLELMKKLVGFTAERWVMPTRLTEMAEAFHVAGLPERLAFHAGTRAILGDMPVWAFHNGDLKAREGVRDCMQKVYDDTVAAEEARKGEL